MAYDLVIVGDSISLEPYAHDATGYVRQLAALCPQKRIDSWANGGRTYGAMDPAARALCQIRPRRLLAALGSNDINTGNTAANMIIIAEIIRAAAVAMGVEFFVWTVPPCSSWNAGQNAERNDFNDNYARTFYEHCIDADLLLRDPAAPNSLDPRYLIASEPADVIHPNTAGGRLLALAIRSQMALG